MKVLLYVKCWFISNMLAIRSCNCKLITFYHGSIIHYNSHLDMQRVIGCYFFKIMCLCFLYRRYHCLFLFRGCVLEKNVLVGRGTRIGSDTRITDSVIGKDCKIGKQNVESWWISHENVLSMIRKLILIVKSRKSVPFFI